MKWLLIVFVNALLTNLINVNANTGTVHRRFEYKYSFKPPYLAQRDQSVPFFEYGGSEYLNLYFNHIEFVIITRYAIELMWGSSTGNSSSHFN